MMPSSGLTRRDQADSPSGRQREWYLLSSHGIVFFYIAANAGCTIQEISTALFISRRSVWSLVGDLKRAGMIEFRREGRTHHYSANLDSKLPHPAFRGRTMSDLAKSLMRDAEATPKE